MNQMKMAESMLLIGVKRRSDITAKDCVSFPVGMSFMITTFEMWCDMSSLREGFAKVAQSGGTFIVATFFNPETKEEYSCSVRDYEYEDCSRDNDELYYMDIDEEVKNEWLHHNGVILVDDTVRVVKGRKVPIGTVAKVKSKYPLYDRYHRWIADYLYLDNGMKTNEKNCILVK